jgi:hypothetical protein
VHCNNNNSTADEGLGISKALFTFLMSCLHYFFGERLEPLDELLPLLFTSADQGNSFSDIGFPVIQSLSLIPSISGHSARRSAHPRSKR